MHIQDKYTWIQLTKDTYLSREHIFLQKRVQWPPEAVCDQVAMINDISV